MEKKKVKKEPEKVSKKKDRKSEEKTTKKKLIIIGTSILLGLIVIGVIIFFCIKNSEVKFDKDWQQIYYNYIKADIIDKGIDEDGKYISYRPYITTMNNPKMTFVEDGFETPVLIIKGEIDSEDTTNNQAISVHFIQDKKTDAVTNLTFHSADEIIFLYNIETKEYNWYIKQQNSTTTTYTSIKDAVEVSINNLNKKEGEQYESAKSYNFSETSTDTTKFEDIFIEIDKASLKLVPIKKDSSISDLKDLIIKTSANLKEKDKYITKKAKSSVQEKLTAIEEEKKAIEEAKAAEEEAKKKAEEESVKQQSSSLNVGSYTLDYGTYKSIISETPITITLNSNGSCTYVGADPHSGNGSYNTTCTYKTTYEDIYGYGDMNYGIRLYLNNGVTAVFVVSSNNAFGSDWLGFTHS